jgi:hypothetical protein
VRLLSFKRPLSVIASLITLSCSPPPADLTTALVSDQEVIEAGRDMGGELMEDMGVSMTLSAWPRLDGVWRVDQSTTLRS